MASAVLQTIPLGPQWPTLDPFLFCAHHLDHYPAANGAKGPATALTGRSIGQDFANIDGWNMYHGSTVPGFPQHPHRGFETVTYVRRGWCDHSDSLGAQARFGQGDVQWLTAAAGIVHSEMFPLFDIDGPNPLHLFQIWLNLPSRSKMVAPYFSMLWSDTLGNVEPAPGVTVTVIAGSFDTAEAPAPPPDSWASGPNGVEIWHLRIADGATCELPPAAPGAQRVVYFFDGERLGIAGTILDVDTGAVLDPAVPAALVADGADAEAIVLSGVPIGEPVAQQGPFVMNDQAEIEQTVRDYQSTRFGGWPWPDDDPVHNGGPTRFALRPDGQRETP